METRVGSRQEIGWSVPSAAGQLGQLVIFMVVQEVERVC